MTEAAFPVRVAEIHYEAIGTLSFILRATDGHALPPVDPGSHVDIHLPNGLVRSYSLSNGAADEGSYRLTVARDASSKGGSAYLHETLRCGEVIKISEPRNNFRLAEDAQLSIFFAGGIGVTPFVPMITRLNSLGRRWRLHYAVRNPARAALLTELEALAAAGSGELLPNYDEVPGGAMLNLEALLSTAEADSHVYCCGPTGMLEAFRRGADAAGIEGERIHFEYFSSNVKASNEGGFTVVLAKTNREIAIAPGQSILDAVNKLGLNVAYSCQEGVCSACETRVLEGIPDHRDVILNDVERAENKTMMICCSGSKTPRLILDL
jgi:ferredoxin-NADP reductase